MAAAIELPFLHPTLLLAVVGTTVVAAFLLPVGRWRLALSALLGGVVGATLVLARVMPLWGGLHLAAYGLMLALGSLCAWWMISYRAPLVGIARRDVTDLCLVALVAGVIGARVRHVYERWGEFAVAADGTPRSWNEIIVLAADLDSGGAVWYGGLLAAILACWVLMRWRGIPVLPYLDLAGPGLLVGIAIGRVGCYLNGCCFGAPTTVPWSVTCPVPPHGPVHPAQFYESLACLVLAAVAWWWWPRRRVDGRIIWFTLVGYAVWRFGNEMLRGDHDIPRTWGGLTPSQVTSVVLALGATLAYALVAWRRRTTSGTPGRC
jgi:phosphatidylglycerol:prolipoprotein diacylglycerol transferase